MKRRWLLATVLFAIVFVAHAVSPVATSADSRWTVHLALSLWDRGDLDLTEYRPEIATNHWYGVECVNRGVSITVAKDAATCAYNYYSQYPIGGPVLASPLIVLVRDVFGILAPYTSARRTGRPMLDALLAGDVLTAYGAVEVIVASAFVAATAALLFLIASRFLAPGYAIAIALVFAFSTPAWSTGSRALWQHTPSMLMIAAVIYLLLEAERRPWCAALAGLPVALSYTIRPTNALFVLIITAYVFSKHRRQLAGYLAAAAPVAAIFFAYNWVTYGALLSPYYRLSPPEFDAGAFASAAAANLISPARGLFVFMPAALLSVYGVRKLDQPLFRYLSVWVVLHWLAVSSFTSFWWGGYSFGPRFLTDTVPVLVLLLIPALAARDKPLLKAALIASLCFGVWVHGRGAWRFAVHEWNAKPVSVDLHPERVWDWSDPPFLR